ncbi:MAG: isoamylase early set domain-containing protein [Gemmatimonadaceae bacterium]
MRETDDVIERVAMSLRRERVVLTEDFDARVMSEVRAASRDAARGGVLRWMLRPRTVSVSPLGGLALAAGVTGIVALAVGDEGPRDTVPPAVTTAVPATQFTPASSTEQMTRFVFVAPSASTVTVVGDFNDWDSEASPLQRQGKGVWTITIPLAPGRYQYTFVVDGTSWVADPGAPRTLEDDFGRPNSVITVGDATT